MTRHPTGQWVTRQARNVTLALGEQADGFRFLVRDRDTKFTASFDAVFADVGIVVLRSPPRAPKANAYAERWVSTIGRECLDRMLIFGERQLVHVLAAYATQYTSHGLIARSNNDRQLSVARFNCVPPAAWCAELRSSAV